MRTSPQAEAAAAPRAIEGFFADPHLARFGDRYWLYPTTDGIEGWGATAFRAFSSSDLASWQDEGEVFSVADQTEWADGFAWAPAVAHRGGRYYLYFTAEQHIGVAVGEHPRGPFVDSGRPLVGAGDFPGTAIDPSVFVDDDDVHYLLWGNGVAHIVPLGDDLVSFDPDAVVSFVPGAFREAATLHRRGDTYYLSWSENDTRDPEYRVCYATGPSPFGPWQERGVLLEQRSDLGVLATGHHSVLRDGDDWYVAYHRFAIPGGDGFHREVVIAPLIHRDGLLQPVRPEDSRPGRAAARPFRRD